MYIRTDSLFADFMKYKILSHPSEFRIRIYGKTIEELFINAVEAMAEVLSPEINLHIDFNDINKTEIKIESADCNSLLVDFLNEILAKSQIDKKIYFVSKIEIKKSEEKAILSAQLFGSRVEKFSEDINAATHQDVGIKQINPPGGEWQTDLVFDI